MSFECSDLDAVRIQKCLWHGFYELCDCGFNGESQLQAFHGVCNIIDQAFREADRKEKASDGGVYITEKDAYWILGLMKRVERAGSELCGKGSVAWQRGPKKLQYYLKATLQAREKCRKDHNGGENELDF